MNLVLFEPNELTDVLPISDRRAQHILTVLRRTEGDYFDAGIVNGPRGKATVVQITPTTLRLIFDPSTPPAPPPPITLIVGLPRPQTARDILRDATTLGVGAIHFVRCERAEPSYAQSTLWTSGEWRRQVVTGAEQAFDTRVPDVTHGRSLKDILDQVGTMKSQLVLDNYEAGGALGSTAFEGPVTLAVGSERGWSGAERDEFRNRGFELVHLGSRVLRTETAVVAAITLVRARLNLG